MIHKAGLQDEIWQAFAVLLPVRTVGVVGDGRTYDQACALRAERGRREAVFLAPSLYCRQARSRPA